MSRILEIHLKYVEEYLAPRFFGEYGQISDQLKEYLLSLLGSCQTEILEQLKRFCTDIELGSLIDEERNVREAVYNDKGDSPQKALQYDEIKKFWDTVLDYREFGRGVRKGKYSITWNRHLFVQMTNVKVCPYCNRNYITSYIEKDKDDEIITTASIDHYYQKARYPFLQMNIYNMIPSCTVCNTYLKGMKEFKHLNPYIDDGSICFKIDLNSIKSLYSSKDNKKRIQVTSGDDQKSKNSVEAFKLSKIYEAHSSMADELQQKVMDYENFAEDYYRKLLGDIDIGIGNVYKNWFDFLDKEEGDEPLVKLKKDIFKQIRGGKNVNL